MNGFPKLDGIRWLSEDFPDLVALKVILVNRSLQEMDIPGMALPETESEMMIDLSKLAGVSPWYPKGSDEPSDIECSVDVEGVSNFVANVRLKDLITAWNFYKTFMYSKLL